MLEEIVQAKSSWSGIVKKGQRLKITDLEGQQAVDFLCYNNNDRSDRYSATNTVKVQGNIYVGLGSILYSDSGIPLLEVVEDTIGRHDTVYGCCSNPNNMLRSWGRLFKTKKSAVKRGCSMSSSNEVLSCFKAYDIRGRLGEELNEDITYRIGRATAQHLKSKDIVIGYDARETSKSLAEACARGMNDGGAHVLNIGLCGTEEVYWAVNSLKAEAGIEVTASHNPIEYNGMKIVKAGSKPLDDEQDFQVIKKLASVGEFAPEIHNTTQHDRAEMARAAYVQKLLSFVSSAALKPLKIVVNSGNGAAGPTFDALENGLKTAGVSAEFIRVHHDPDPSFPNGIPNPLLPENHAATADVVLREGADFGVAFDGDFDRCFLFDETGAFVPGEYIIGLLANVFLEKEQGAKIVHDPRVVWNTRETVSAKGGEPIVSKTGHAFIKATMRECDAIYGGEMSAHHYFRDFAYCDSGMIPWLLIWELISKTEKSLGALLTECRENFPSSGEQNFKVSDATHCLNAIKLKYQDDAERVDELDGVSMEFKDWRFNVRKSNTEPLVRLNVETRGDKELLSEKAQELIAFIKAS